MVYGTSSGPQHHIGSYFGLVVLINTPPNSCGYCIRGDLMIERVASVVKGYHEFSESGRKRPLPFYDILISWFPLLLPYITPPRFLLNHLNEVEHP